jgi:hypothetical protein
MFNTGKIKIPGIKSNEMFLKVTHDLLGILKKIIPDIEYINKPVNVIINSDFVCGFFIDRDKFNSILKNKYNLQTVYVPWYPGINCKFYYDSNVTNHNGQAMTTTIENKPISIMIFRTGRVLIVGKCDEFLIHYIYKFISDIIRENYWPTDPTIEWDDTIYDQGEVRRVGKSIRPFFYVPSSTPNSVFKYTHKRFEQLLSKKNSVANLESFIVSIIHMSKTYGFNVFFFDVFHILTSKEHYLIKNFISTHKNVIWDDTHDFRVGDTVYKIKNDGHWNSKGAHKVTTTLYKKSKNWYATNRW